MLRLAAFFRLRLEDDMFSFSSIYDVTPLTRNVCFILAFTDYYHHFELDLFTFAFLIRLFDNTAQTINMEPFVLL